jgi:hypothetical protein
MALVVVAVEEVVVDVVVEVVEESLVHPPQAKANSGAPIRTSRHKKSRTPAKRTPWADIFPSAITFPLFSFV